MGVATAPNLEQFSNCLVLQQVHDVGNMGCDQIVRSEWHWGLCCLQVMRG